ncbi:MAG TPA: radical SAM protein, partial [Lachnospiraceae bacterium]|nr:radical SAM protein [Lachnospiraceae bacterium]
MKKHKIARIIPGSIAEEMEIEVGDLLVRINDQEMDDIFDYQYLVQDEYLEVLIEKPSGEEWLLEIDKDPDE